MFSFHIGAFFPKFAPFLISHFYVLRSTIFYVYIVFSIIFCCSSICFDFQFFCIFFFCRCWRLLAHNKLLLLPLPLFVDEVDLSDFLLVAHSLQLCLFSVSVTFCVLVFVVVSVVSRFCFLVLVCFFFVFAFVYIHFMVK